MKDAQIARTAPATHIYIVQAGTFCKIGITRNMKDRLGQYRVHSPLAVKLRHLLEVPNPRRLEMEVHRRLTADGKLAHGEWFKISVVNAFHELLAVKREMWPAPERTPEQYSAIYEALIGTRRTLKRRRRGTP